MGCFDQQVAVGLFVWIEQEAMLGDESREPGRAVKGSVPCWTVKRSRLAYRGRQRRGKSGEVIHSVRKQRAAPNRLGPGDTCHLLPGSGEARAVPEIRGSKRELF